MTQPERHSAAPLRRHLYALPQASHGRLRLRGCAEKLAGLVYSEAGEFRSESRKQDTSAWPAIDGSYALFYFPESMVSLVDEVRELVVASLRLRTRPGQLAADANLFAQGLGLDSVDTVQLIVSIEAHFGVTFSDAELAARPLTSIEAFVDLLTQKGVGARP